MNRAVLLLGGNLGNVPDTFTQVRVELGNHGQLVQQSAIYQSPSWGFESANMFYNQIVLLDTSARSDVLLQQILDIEQQLGRIRNEGEGYASRMIDIDILFYANQVLNTPELTIPHPRLHIRRFTLAPLTEVLPDYRHPVLKKTMTELLNACEDPAEVIIFEP